MKKVCALLAMVLSISTLAGCSSKEKDPATMTLIGHATVKIKTSEGVVIYIDPYGKGDYTEEADIVLVTHGHDDHCALYLINKKDSTQILSRADFHDGGDEYASKEVDGIKITSVPAYNSNHNKDTCVGYILEFDGIKLYHAGDTSYIEEMNDLSDDNITYALLPTDGRYNMDAAEASKCADVIGAKHTISIHNYEVAQDELFQTFTTESRLFVAYGETITLEP